MPPAGSAYAAVRYTGAKPAEGSAAAVEVAQRRVADCERIISASAMHSQFAKDYLPRVLGDDAALTELSLRATQATDVNAGSLADALRGNSAVTRVDLSDNLLEAAGAHAIADCLTVNTALTELDLRGNGIDEDGGRVLADALEANTTLRELWLERNPHLPDHIRRDCETLVKINSRPPELKAAVVTARNGGPRLLDLGFDTKGQYRDLVHDPTRHLDCFAAEVLADALVGNRCVEELSLTYQHVSDDGARALAGMLMQNEKLDRINLFGNAVTDDGAAAFKAALQVNNTCTIINLKNNACGEEALYALERALVLNRQPLTLKKWLPSVAANDPDVLQLKLDEHASCRQYDDVSARLIADVLPENGNLTALDLAHNAVGDVGAHFLADALQENTGLRVLDLSHNPVRGAGAAHLADALRENTSLNILRVAGCGIDDAGGTALAEALRENDGLTELDLRDNPLVCDCGSKFVRVLQVNTGLTELALQGTGVSNVVLRALQDSRALNQEPPALRSIAPRLYNDDPDLTAVRLTPPEGEYPLSDSACNVLGPILRDNYVLTDLDLSKNAITTVGVKELCAGLVQNRFTLRRLSLAGNGELDYEAARALCGVMRTHQALTALDLSNNRLLDAGGEEFFQFLANEPSSSQLIDLDLRGNRMDPDLERNLMVVTQSHRCLPGLKQRLMGFFSGKFRGDEVLDFSELEAYVDPETPERVFDEAARVLGLALEGCPHHTGLAFRHNRLGDDGARHVAELFKGNRSLVRLDLSHNRLTDVGVEHIIEMVQHRPELSSVLLEGNKLVTEDILGRLKYDMQFNRQPDCLKHLLIDVLRNDPEDPACRTIDCSHFDGGGQITDSRLTYICEALAKSSTVERIDLSHNHITIGGARLLLDTLRVCPKVAHLSLRNNVLDGAEAAETLAGLLRDPSAAALTSVDLSHNELDASAVGYLLDALRENDRLLDLRLDGNRIPEDLLEEVAIALSLNRELEVKRLLPRLRASDPSVIAVDFSGRRANDIAVYSLCAALRGNTAVLRLDLSDNPAVTDVSFVNYIAPLLRDNASPLSSLNVSRTGATVIGACAVMEALVTNTTLQYLDLRGCRLENGRNVVAAAEAAIEANSVILSIELEDTGMTPNEIARVTGKCLNGQPLLRQSLPRLEDDDPALRSLCFADTEEITHDNVTCRLLADALAHNGSLRSLDLSGSRRIDDRGATHLAMMLHQNTGLVSMSLQGCAITDKGVEPIAAALRVNTVLTELDLSNNWIGDEGADKLTRALSVAGDGFGNDVLTVLRMHGNDQLSESSATTLASEIILNNGPLSLKHDLPKIKANTVTILAYREGCGGRKFTDVYVELLANAMTDNRSVTAIDLSNNSIEWNGAERLSDLLRRNESITSLNLANNEVGSGGAILLEAMKHNWTMLALNVAGNGCNQYDYDRLQELVLLNHHPPALKKAIMRTVDRDPSQITISINALPSSDTADDAPPALTDDGCDLLAEHLKTDLAAQVLDLSWNRVSCRGAELLTKMLRQNAEVKTLNLGHNLISGAGAKCLASIMCQHKNLSDVDISFNAITRDAVEPIMDAIRENSNIMRCCVNDNEGFDDDMIEKTQVLVILNHKSKEFRSLFHRVADCHPDLTEVNMEGWLSLGFYDGNSTDLVARSVALNPAIQSLNLAFCDVTDEQLVALAQLVGVAPNLRDINLSNNLLTSDISCLTHALSDNHTIVNLALRDNRIGLEGAKLIAVMLRSNDHLQELDLSGNIFGDTGAKIIAEGVKMNDSLQHVFCEGQGVSKKAQLEIELALDLSYRQVVPAEDADPSIPLEPPVMIKP